MNKNFKKLISVINDNLDANMNILHVITHGGWAGSESIAASIANEQVERGDNVSVILRHHRSFKDKDILNKFNKSINVYWVEQNETHPDAQIKRLLKDEKFISCILDIDICHAHLPYGCQLGSLLREQLAANFEICVSMHVRYHPLYYLADKIFTVAKWQAQEIPNDYQGKIFTIENFLCENKSSSAKRLSIFKKKYHIDDNLNYIVYIGRLDLVKGADILIRAFNYLSPQNYKLIIVGDGPESSSLKKIASEDIIFTGKILDASFILGLADICVVPSRFESFGLVLLEAINAECRIIASNIPSFREILNGEKHLFDNESVVSLSERINEYILEPRQGFVDQNMISEYSLKSAMAKLEFAYSEYSAREDENVVSDIAECH